MSKKLREGLLAAGSPQNQSAIEAELFAQFDERERRRQRTRRMTAALWIYLVGLSTFFLVLGGMRSDTLGGIWFGILACFWFGFGALFMNKNWHEENRLQTAKALARIELLLEGRRSESEEPTS